MPDERSPRFGIAVWLVQWTDLLWDTVASVHRRAGGPPKVFGILLFHQKWVPHPSLFSSEGWGRGGLLGQAAEGLFAVSSIPSACITASVVFSVGFPFSLKER